MILFYSGQPCGGLAIATPECVLKRPGVMMTYWWWHGRGKPEKRYRVHERQRRKRGKK